MTITIRPSGVPDLSHAETGDLLRVVLSTGESATLHVDIVSPSYTSYGFYPGSAPPSIVSSWQYYVEQRMRFYEQVIPPGMARPYYTERYGILDRELIKARALQELYRLPVGCWLKTDHRSFSDREGIRPNGTLSVLFDDPFISPEECSEPGEWQDIDGYIVGIFA